MDLIKTGLGISKTMKNVARLREILTVFAKHGFDEFIIKSNMHAVIPNFVLPKSRLEKVDELSGYDFWKTIGYRLRKSFEELGPSFIKLGQLLATREDLFDPALISELKKLQNKANPIEFSSAKIRITNELKKPFYEVFESIEEEPIGLASIGVVYRAKLTSGEDVVVKVRRPNIRKTILVDFEIMLFLVNRIEKASTELKFLGIGKAIRDFFKNIENELNFLIEANNNEKLKNNISKIDKEKIFKIPKIYREYTTEKILVMEYLVGTPFNEIENIENHPELKENLIKGVKLFMHTMLADGFFHADLHGGNFFKLEDNKIGLIDFGLVGALSKKNRSNLIAILYALVTNNFENLVYEFLDVAEYESVPDHEELIRDIRDTLTPFVGLSVQETDVTQLTHAIVLTLSKHEIYLPREWFIIFRALMTLDGVGKSLDIDLNIFEIIDSNIHNIMNELISKDALIEDAAWLGRDLLNSIRIIPRHIKWALKEHAKKRYSFDINLKGTNNEINLLSRSIYFLALMILTSTFFISGVFIIGENTVKSIQDIPIITIVCWGLAALSVFRASVVFKIK